MGEFTLQPIIALESHRCYTCRRWYSYEKADASKATCPYCASARIERAEKAQARAARQARSLRGALTRSRGRRKS